MAWLYQRLEDRRIQRAWMEYMHTLYDPAFTGWERFNRALEVFGHKTRKADIPLLAIIMPPAGSLQGEYPFAFAHQKIQSALEHAHTGWQHEHKNRICEALFDLFTALHIDIKEDIEAAIEAFAHFGA